MQAEPKDGVFTKLDDKDTAPSRCLSIFMYTFNSDGKVTDIKFLRQPSKDEMARKVSCCSWPNACKGLLTPLQTDFLYQAANDAVFAGD